MQRFARIADGRVAEIMELPDTVRDQDGVDHQIDFAVSLPPDLMAALVPCVDPAVVHGWACTRDAQDHPTFVAPAVAAPTIPQLLARAAACRYSVETGGILVNGAPIATDRASQAMVGNAHAYVQASGAASVSYKTAAGFVTLTAEQIKAVALAVGAHVQACFAAEDAADAAVNASPPTIATYAQVEATFAALAPPA